MKTIEELFEEVDELEPVAVDVEAVAEATEE